MKRITCLYLALIVLIVFASNVSADKGKKMKLKKSNKVGKGGKGAKTKSKVKSPKSDKKEKSKKSEKDKKSKGKKSSPKEVEYDADDDTEYDTFTYDDAYYDPAPVEGTDDATDDGDIGVLSTGNCVDDSSFEFETEYLGSRNCVFLNKKERRQEKYCNSKGWDGKSNRRVKHYCRNTCYEYHNFSCKYYDSITISPGPTEFYIRNVGNGKCLQLEDGECRRGGKIELWDCNGRIAQRFRLDGDTIVHAKCDMVVEVPNNRGYCHGEQLQINDDDNGSNQVFKYNTRDNTFLHPRCDRVIDNRRSFITNGNKIRTWKKNGSAAQQWLLDEV